ncbi:MAG TPA: ATP-dependent zinc metalloprotease FtsH [Candidatus Fusicatenibacter merdavium]|uniref:ATP-dependent zinc metalloprotease FtsH n=1 Tax=Candidatus Fusicatenibacter merdavium TaxID=2838600 RepID=A0A9D1XEZ8_9FIRM|nr:ATP-dependent zinc metalloprotease FtsH [Candidatus Fusicatenibacter merdavium]
MDNKPNNQNQDPQGPGNGEGPRNKQTLLMVLVCILVALMFLGLMNNVLGDSSQEEISYSQFLQMVEDDQVDEVIIQSNILTIIPDPDSSDPLAPSEYQTVLVGDEESLKELLDENDIPYRKEMPDGTASLIYSLVSVLLPVILLVGVMVWLMRSMNKGGGMMGGVGKSKAKTYVQKETGVLFKDVAGQDEAKESLQEVVDFLHNPGKYTKIGAKLPKGALLVGPPGTGKTLLAKAVAGEAHVPFFSLSGSEFVEMFVGVGASRVRDLFEEAKKNAPCIIFIDEIDAIGKTRDSHYGGNDEREQTLNQLLAEMDGFDTSKGLLILAATNRPEVLDPALLRPGRFDRRIIVERPDLKGRVEILKVHAKNVLLDESVDLEGIALATSGAVGSDLANMINEAAILAVKNGRKAVSQKDLLEAVEVVLVGKEKKDRILSQEERRIVSYHEVGHAMISALQKDSEPVQKITIVPRTMGALGYVMQVPEEEKYLNTKSELEAMIVECLGGRAAEEIVFGNVTTGASNDIEKATKIVRAMITQYGMSEKFGLMGLATQENQYLDGRIVLNCGDATATEIDHEVMRVLKEAYETAKTMLAANRETMDRIAAHLIEKETITGKEFMEIFHQSQSESGKALPSGEEGQTSDDGVTADDSLPVDGEKTAQVSQPTGGEASAQNGAAESSLPVKDNVLESETVEYV